MKLMLILVILVEIDLLKLNVGLLLFGVWLYGDI